MLQVHAETTAEGTRLSTYTLLDGSLTTHTSELAASNYLQATGFHGGRMRFTLQVDRSTGAGLRRAELVLGSALVRTQAHPYEVELSLPSEVIEADVDGRAVLPYRLVRRNGLTDGAGFVRVAASSDALVIADPRREFASINEGLPGSFQVRAAKPGTYRVQIQAVTRYNDPGGEVVIRFSRLGQTSRSPGLAELAGLAGFVGLILLLLEGRRRAARRSGG